MATAQQGEAGAAQPAASDAQRVADGMYALQQWYVESNGLYAPPTGWWNAANSMTVLANYSRVTGSTLYLPVMENTFRVASAASHTHDFLNAYNDDEGWWALAWTDAYDLTGQQQYLAMSETIFADMTTQWETKTCGGGIWWTKNNGGSYKNAIANELFLSVAASLANRETDAAKKAEYLGWAQKEWAWFHHSGMINEKNLVNDGLDSNNPAACTNNGRRVWSYNQGVVVGGLVELYKATHDAELLATANAIASATVTNLVNADGVMVDGAVRGNDAPQFKGVFVRNLSALYAISPQASYKQFIRTNAESIWMHDQNPSHQFGALWQGPFDSGDATRQASALDTLIAAMQVK